MNRDNGLNPEQDQIDLSKYLRAIQFNFFRILLIGAIFFGLWLTYYTQSPRIYQIISLIQVKAPNSINSADLEKILFSNGEDINLEEQISLYNSYTNKSELVDKLNLNLVINYDDFQLENQKKLKINNFVYAIPKYKKKEIFILKPSQDAYQIYDSQENLIGKGVWSENSDMGELIANISKPKNLEEDFRITFFSKDEVIEKALNGKLRLNKLLTNRYLLTQGTLLSVSYISENRELGKKIIDTANEIFLNRSIEISSQEAQQSLNYIENQLNILNLEIETTENKFNNFKNKNISVDIELEILGLVDQVNLLKEQIAANELKIAEARSIYKSTNPFLEKIITQSNELRRQEIILEEQIKRLPNIQKEYLELKRELDLNKAIYESLLSSKLEFSLLEASTLGNVRIIDDAYVNEKISPDGFTSLLLTIVIAGFVSIMYAILRQLYFSPIRLPSDIAQEFPNLQLLGILNLFKNTDELQTSEAESVNSLATNLLISIENVSTSSECPVVLITGPTPLVGKSTTSYLLSNALADRKKKTLVLDLDYKRGDLHKNFNKNTTKTSHIIEKDFNSNDFKINDFLYFLPRPKGQAAKALSIFESMVFAKRIEELKKEFDIIIFDTPPILSVSEALVLAKFCDIICPVVRHNESKFRDIAQMLQEFELIKKDVDYAIYNAFSKPKGYYGYDYYAYKYYSNYDYYSYDSKEK